MLSTIEANDLKVRGVKLIEQYVSENEQQEVLVNVRGKTKYAILPIKYFNKLRECEIESALKESLDDIKSGKIFIESVDKHIKRISKK
jgi:hypothetical protein